MTRMLAVTLLFVGAGTSVLRGAEPDARANLPESVQKLGWIYTLAKYTAWPDKAMGGADQPFTLGVLGNDPFGPDINFLTSTNLKSRRIEVKFYRSAEEVAGCHVLFVAGKEVKVSSELIEKCRSGHVLTFGEGDEFESQGGMLTFFKKDKLVMTAVNVKALKAAKLQMDANLIKSLLKEGSQR